MTLQCHFSFSAMSDVQYHYHQSVSIKLGNSCCNDCHRVPRSNNYLQEYTWRNIISHTKAYKNNEDTIEIVCCPSPIHTLLSTNVYNIVRIYQESSNDL